MIELHYLEFLLRSFLVLKMNISGVNLSNDETCKFPLEQVYREYKTWEFHSRRNNVLFS